MGYFSKIDELISPELPLTWMFIRPPWANAAGVRKSLKECMLLKIEEKCNAEEVCFLVIKLRGMESYFLRISSEALCMKMYENVFILL